MSLLVWKGPTNALVLANNSPTLVYGDRVKATDIYNGPQSLCAESMLARGTYGTGSRAGWVVNQCTTETSRGTIGKLTIDWEAGGTGADQPLPTGEVSLQPQELYPKIERNAFFANSGSFLLPMDIALAYASMHASTSFARQNALDQLAGRAASGDATIAASATLGQSLAAKLQRGEETYYQAGFRYVWVYYTYTLPTINVGGITETPTGPVTPSYDSTINWIRLADGFEPAGVNGSMWKMTLTWLGGQDGYWDTDLYPT
jgi:hypothetical protein